MHDYLPVSEKCVFKGRGLRGDRMPKMLKGVKKSCLYIFACLFLIVQIYPVLWIFMTSFKSEIEISEGNTVALPKVFSLVNYINTFEKVDVGRYFFNSIVVTGFSLLLICLLSSTAAFAVRKMNFKITRFLKIFFIAGIMVPVHIALIPMFTTYRKLGLLNSHFGLIMLHVGFAIPMSIYMFDAFYRYIPDNILESAVIDGCGIYKLFTSIVVPMSKNTYVTIITMNFMFIWNEFVLTNTFISKTELKTIPLAVYEFTGDYGLKDWGGIFAMVSLTIIPILIVYFLLNKSIIAGMTAGAVKE